MIQIVFRNEETPGQKVFHVTGVQVFTRSIVAVIDGKETLLATGRGRRWQVGYRFFHSVEIESTTLKLVERKVA